PMSRQGKRQALILLLGVVTIWIFALWSLITILQDGVSGVEWVSMALMLGLLLVAPVVAWVLLEEANSRFIVSSKGIQYRTLAGISLDYGWEDLTGFAPAGGRSRLARFFLGDDEPRESGTGVEAAPDPATGGTEDEDEPQTLLLRV